MLEVLFLIVYIDSYLLSIIHITHKIFIFIIKLFNHDISSSKSMRFNLLASLLIFFIELLRKPKDLKMSTYN